MVCCKRWGYLRAVKSGLAILSLFLMLLLTGCVEDAPLPEEPGEPRVVILPTQALQPSAGDEYIQENHVTIDISNTDSGYVKVRYTGLAGRVVAQIEREGTFTFDINTHGYWEVLPLNMGNGYYTVRVLENIEGQMFALAVSTTVDVNLRHHTLPFLYPNQYVNFNQDSKAVALAATLAEGATSDLEVVRRIYSYITENIEYDHEFANAIIAGEITRYIPDIDATLISRRGICFDYAALMTAMLRAQKIPARLEIGYVTGGIYHAWISVYIEDMGGWINMIRFETGSWTIMDPTLSAGGKDGKTLAEFIGEDANYWVMRIY